MKDHAFSPAPTMRASSWLRSSVGLLIGLQILLLLVVVSALWFSSEQLRTANLAHMYRHGQVQTHNLEDRLSQSFDLLEAHLRPLADGDKLLVSYRVSRLYPWLVQSQASQQAVLLHWRQQTRQLGLLVAGIMALLLLSTSYLTWRVHRSVQEEARLRKENRLAANVFTHTSDLILITDERGEAVSVNPAFERLTGHSADEIIGHRPQYFAPAQQTLERDLFPHIWEAVNTAGQWQGEVIQARRDGGQLPGWLSVNAILNGDGAVTNYVGVLRDLSRLRADEALIRQLSNAVEQSPSSIVITSTAPSIEYANPEFFRVTGYSKAEVIGANPRILQSGLTKPSTYRALWTQLQAGRVWHGEFINRRKDGSIYIESASVAPLTDSNGRITHYLGIKHDITHQKETENSLRLAASVIDNTHDGVVICDAAQRIVEVNPAFVRITGYRGEELIGQNPAILNIDQDGSTAYTALLQALDEKDHWQGELWNRHKNGQPYAIFITINAIRNTDDELTHFVGVFSDITVRKKNEQKLLTLAHHAPLTGLPNRTLLGSRVHQAIASAQSRQQLFAIGLLDLDGFKAINDTFGHDAGDELLTSLAHRLQASLRSNDTAARLGGDALLRHADQAMYQAKQGGRNRHVLYQPRTTTDT